MVDFDKFDIAAAVTESLIDMFDRMLSMKLEPAEDPGASVGDGERIVGSMSLTGKVKGSVTIEISDEFSRIMTAAMLGIDIDEIEETEDVIEIVGKAWDAVGGNLKSKFGDAGLICEISPPSFTSGNDFINESKNHMRYERCAFRCGEETIFAEIGLTIDEEALPAGQPDDAGGNQQHAADSSMAHQDGPTPAPPKPGRPSGETGTAPDPPRRSDDEAGGKHNFNMVMDLPVEITVELGRTSILTNDLLKLCNGSVVEFSNLAGEPVDVLINQKLIAKGHIVVEDEKYGVRISETRTNQM